MAFGTEAIQEAGVAVAMQRTEEILSFIRTSSADRIKGLIDETTKQSLRETLAQGVAASQRGDLVLWRNNSGALTDDSGRLIRFGLGNDSAQANRRMKSADLIGIHRPSGRFVSIEVKRPGWKHSDASERDRAQAAWAATVAAMGGVALRVTSAESIKNLEI